MPWKYSPDYTRRLLTKRNNSLLHIHSKQTDRQTDRESNNSSQTQYVYEAEPRAFPRRRHLLLCWWSLLFLFCLVWSGLVWQSTPFNRHVVQLSQYRQKILRQEATVALNSKQQYKPNPNRSRLGLGLGLGLGGGRQRGAAQSSQL